jgi:D-glycero-D-manno-heptose 1,7-bisphosphate phosphatase
MEMVNMKRPAIFLDRDGVINRNRNDHVKSWSEFEFLPGVLAALRRLSQLEWPVVVISNQAVVGRGLVSHQTIDEISARMVAVVHSVGGRIDRAFYCPHRPEENCGCRKPQPGLLLTAAEQMRLDLSSSFFVGDAESDVMAAKAVGCRPVLVKTGRGIGQMAVLRQDHVMGYYLADDLSDAVEWILGPGWMTRFYLAGNQPATPGTTPWLQTSPGVAAWAMS